jgi:NAD(P)-dependent dehydrogenase (short-subunit alcohol dehydrogenase family)
VGARKNNLIMKKIIITGANGNLGSATTSKLLASGYYLIATVAKEDLRSELPSHENLEIAVVDLSDEQATKDFVEKAISKHQQIDAALMLAGGYTPGDLDATPAAVIYQQLSLNFLTAYHVARPLFKHMLEKEQGRLVFIGARPALEPAAGKDAMAYSLSKAMLFKLAENLNAATKGKNISASVVVPSIIDTKPNRKSMPKANPDNWVKPELIASLLEMLISDLGMPLRETVLKVYNNS